MSKLLFISIIISLIVIVIGIENYCSIHTYRTNGTFMQFTKEPNFEEFVLVGNFKALHCCAKGYRSIEWYKNGKLYPWPLMVSQLILYPESENQTVYTQTVTKEDAGNYTCLLRNESVVHSHTIQLKVLDDVPDDPMITYISQDTEVILGDNLRLFCEAFAGRIDLPDAHNEVIWRKIDRNETALEDDERIKQQKISREDGQTFGTYLTIEDIRDDDYGEYVCKITKPGKSIEQHVYVREKVEVKYLNPNPIPIKKLLLCTFAILFLITVAILLNLRYGLQLRVNFKDTFGTVEDNDGKINDILVLYSNKDDEIVTGILIPTLENYQYICESRQFSDDLNKWHIEYQAAADRCRRIIAVISPAALNNDWTNPKLYQALKQLHNLNGKLCCVLLKDLPKNETDLKNENGENLTTILRIINVLYWNRMDLVRFWLALRLRLPPRRNIIIDNNINKSSKCSRLTSSDSNDSFDVFYK